MRDCARNTPTWRLGMAAAVAVASLGLSAQAAERMVLGEYFTMTS